MCSLDTYKEKLISVEEAVKKIKRRMRTLNRTHGSYGKTRTMGDSFIHVSEIDCIIEASHPIISVLLNLRGKLLCC